MRGKGGLRAGAQLQPIFEQPVIWDALPNKKCGPDLSLHVLTATHKTSPPSAAEPPPKHLARLHGRLSQVVLSGLRATWRQSIKYIAKFKIFQTNLEGRLV
jgi:hypothetical protein